MLEWHANLDRRLEALAYLVLPFVPTRISRSTRQPPGLMNDCSIERQSQSTIQYNLGSFLYWITGPFKDRYPTT